MDLAKHQPPAEVPAKPQTWVQELAYDIALEYHPPEELQEKYNLPAEEYEAVASSPPVKRAVSAYRRMIDEESSQARLKTKKLASVLVEEAAAIAMDRGMEPAVRLRAIENICKYAGLEKSNTDDSSNNNTAPFMVNIQVNT